MKSIRKFEHFNATTTDEAVDLLSRYGGKAWVNAGGTDLMGTMRFDVLRDYPEVVINLKTIPGLDYVKEDAGTLRIGALTHLKDIAVNDVIKARYPALAEAARRTASPHVRIMGTIGGNICQIIRCWYFRTEDNQFDCLRKGSGACYAAIGENRYHSIFGASRVATPPCSANCPASVDIASYLSEIRDGELAAAAATLLDANPLPSITGRVCPHHCERDCNRNELDEGVSIRSIERFLGDYILDNAAAFYQPPTSETGKKIAVIGSGPAGLAAAYYLRKLGHGITVFEARKEPGGVLTYGIPPFRLPKDVVARQIKAIAGTGVEIKCGVEVGKDITLPELESRYDAVFCGTGAWRQAKLRIQDEELLMSGLDFLAQMNSGTREIAAQKVLVIGGGSVAVDVALSARRLGVKEVTIACLECLEEMPAQAEEVEQAVREGVRVMPSWGPLKALHENGRVSGMELIRCASVFNAAGKFSPEYDDTVKETVEAEQIILAIGQRPEVSYAEKLLKIDGGLIAVDPQTQATSDKKVYAGGDATIIGSLSVAAAVGAGRRAAVAINERLGGKAAPGIQQKTDYLTRYTGDDFEKLGRVENPQRATSEVSLDKEDILGLEQDAIEAEANRCINCGCVGVNPSDLAPALVALNARIITTKRSIDAGDFWATDNGAGSTVLDEDEIVTEVQIPQGPAGVKSSFIKFALRKSIDFPIVNCAAAVESKNGVVTSARICLNAVYGRPYRAAGAEAAIKGKRIDEASAEAAGAAAVSNAVALPYNSYKIQIARALVKRAILACK